MDKIVVLELDGDLEEKGFQATLHIGDQQEPQQCKAIGYLPQNPDLADHLEDHWQEKYRTLGSPYRLYPRRIIRRDGLVSECQVSAQQLKDKFTNWLNSEEFDKLDKRLREHLNLNDKIRFLISTDSQQLKLLPWQEWDIVERYQGAEVAFSNREFEPPPSESPTVCHQLRILAIFGHGQDLDLEEDRRQLENLPHTQVKFLEKPSLEKISNQLWSQPWDILFFAGHSETRREEFAGHSETEGEEAVIYLNPQETLCLDEIKNGLREAIARGLKLAIFNSCDGLGLITQLRNEELQIPNLIVMREAVPDKVAHAFLKYFLHNLVAGESLYIAQRRAREQLEGLESEFPCASWLPVLYQNQATVKLPQIIPPPPKTPWWKTLRAIVLISLATTLSIGGLRWFGKFQPLELGAYDVFTQLQPKEKPGKDPRLLVITIDNQDLIYQKNQGMEIYGSLSLADAALVQVLRKLEKLNPSLIGLDIYHSHRFSTDLVNHLRQSDTPFYVVCKTDFPTKSVLGDPPDPQDLASKYWAFSDIVIDRDRVVRRHLLTMETPSGDPCRTETSFSLSLAQHYLDLVLGGIEAENTATELRLGDRIFPKLTDHTSGYQGMDSRGSQIMLNYRSYPSPQNIAQSISLRQILDQGIPDNLVNRLKQPIVIIGVTVRGESYHEEFFKTPYGEEIPGVFLQAQMTSQIISAVLDERPLISWWSVTQEWLWIGGWSLLGGLFLFLSRNPWKLQLILIFNLGILLVICYLLFLKAIWIPLIPPAIALIITTELSIWWLVILPKIRNKKIKDQKQQER